MKHELRYIGEKIVRNSLSLAHNVANVQDTDYTKKIDKAGLEVTQRIEYREELIRYFGEALYAEDNKIEEKVVSWGERAANLSINYNIPLSDVLRAISHYRTVVWDVFTEELEKQQFAPITMLDVSKRIDPLLDRVLATIGSVYEKHNSNLMAVAYTALEELSVPVVPVFEGVAVIPLVGPIDSQRAKLIMDIALNEGQRLKLSNIIVDVSGVPIIDTMVADKLFQITKALRLLGIKVIISGIRPEIAQTVVSLGLDFSQIDTYKTMQIALQSLGYRQIKKQP